MILLVSNLAARAISDASVMPIFKSWYFAITSVAVMKSTVVNCTSSNGAINKLFYEHVSHGNKLYNYKIEK
jgi:hypothetical protein